MQLFVDKNINQLLEERGYVTIPLLSTEETARLRGLYESLKTDKKDTNARLFVSSRDCDYDKSMEVSQLIKEILLPHIEKIATHFTLYGGAFLAKPRHDTNEFALHQDFTLTEPAHRMYAIWIALQDTDEKNGAVFLLEKSHRVLQNFLSASYNNVRIDRKDIHPDFIQTISLKAGQAIIFCDQLFHGSYSNKTNQERVAATARITDKDAPFVYYHKQDDSTAAVYEIAPFDLIKYFEHFQKGNIPEHLTLKYTVPYKHTSVNSKLLNKRLREINGWPAEGLVDRLKRIFR